MAAKASLERDGHVCLKMVGDSEQLAERLSQVYSGRMPLSDFTATMDAESVGDEDDQQIQVNAQCENRMSALQNTTVSGDNQ